MPADTLLEITHEMKLDHDNVRDLFERYKVSEEEVLKKKITHTLIKEMMIHGYSK